LTALLTLASSLTAISSTANAETMYLASDWCYYGTTGGYNYGCWRQDSAGDWFFQNPAGTWFYLQNDGTWLMYTSQGWQRNLSDDDPAAALRAALTAAALAAALAATTQQNSNSFGWEMGRGDAGAAAIANALSGPWTAPDCVNSTYGCR